MLIIILSNYHNSVHCLYNPLFVFHLTERMNLPWSRVAGPTLSQYDPEKVTHSNSNFTCDFTCVSPSLCRGIGLQSHVFRYTVCPCPRAKSFFSKSLKQTNQSQTASYIHHLMYVCVQSVLF